MNYKMLPKIDPSDPQTYARIDNDGIIRLSCTAEYPEFKEWVEEGNVPLPEDGQDAD
jgi:hypothetical protein